MGWEGKGRVYTCDESLVRNLDSRIDLFQINQTKKKNEKEEEENLTSYLDFHFKIGIVLP